MPLPTLNLLSRNSWPFSRRADREARPTRAQTEPMAAHRQPGAGIDDVADPRHADNSSLAQDIRSEHRRAMRSGEIPARPAHPPGFDAAFAPPSYQPTPREREITVDANLRGPVRDLRHPGTASQGLAEPGSEHFRDFANPFRTLSSRNQPAPQYPHQPQRESPEATPTHINYLPFPHEKEASPADALRGRNHRGESSSQPASDRHNAPRRGPEAAPRRRRVNWDAVGRGVLNALAVMGGGPVGRM